MKPSEEDLSLCGPLTVVLPPLEEQTTNNEYSIDLLAVVTSDIPPPKADFSAPPPYEANPSGMKLPTYEDVQREKCLHGESSPELCVSKQCNF